MTPLKQADAIAIVQPIEATVTVGPFARLRPAGPLAVAIVCVALFAAGCGGQSTPRFNEANVMTSALRFVACMRSHGVPNMPDPQVFHSAGKTGITEGQERVAGLLCGLELGRARSRVRDDYAVSAASLRVEMETAKHNAREAQQEIRDLKARLARTLGDEVAASAVWPLTPAMNRDWISALACAMCPAKWLLTNDR